MAKIAVLGAGSWGIASSVLLFSNGHQVTLWEFDHLEMTKLAKDREHKEKLPGIVIPKEIKITDDLTSATLGTEMLALALPSHTVREVAKKLARLKLPDPIIVNLAKGIENDTLCRMSEILKEELSSNLHDKIATLSGPSHAEEVSRKIPTTVVVAGFQEKIAKRIQQTFMNPYFRVYTNSDIVGVELGGSLKNVIAIAAGICDGMGLGDNSRGALLTRGLAEIIRLGEKLGAKRETFAGLSGLGDLVTTCISRYSRNRFVGEQIGKGKTLNQILKEMTMVAEGIKTTKSAYQLSIKYEVEMPITQQVYQVLFENRKPQQAITELMTRDPKSEIWG
ncbi:glycerol-3-phosphate dehydrogenase [candidate division WOR-1 bacterium DG_54_3]|uniref:Glycerol-3-phosphate dehydrogenase [NAD(P)+] n=1 Tax=candidate division WOR-1 bacterium DG_54_3 TaxID=1703775 RepID=A0A0S7XW84_UNCSA|nr:MAG: glycerol-3-phosphate dehydrogenase [candidate division WOR-1 bacterium DG_54_3]